MNDHCRAVEGATPRVVRPAEWPAVENVIPWTQPNGTVRQDTCAILWTRAGYWIVTLSEPRLAVLWGWAANAFLVCTAMVVLTAPVFPSQDGPVHLYYVDVIRSLLTHSGPYAGYFEIKGLLTPYSLEYFALLVLEMAFPPALSEKLLVCCYIFAFIQGFRYLVESVTERRSPWTLAGIPFCMNSLVYMGFMNYSIGVAMSLFLSGFWIRYWRRLRLGHTAVLLSCLYLMLITHPVPVAVFLLFVGIHFVADLARALAAGSESVAESFHARRGPLAIIVCMAGIAAGWLSLFVARSQSAFVSVSAPQVDWANRAAAELQLSSIVPFTPLTYRAGLLCLLAIAGLALLVSFWKYRGRASSAAIAMMATGAVCFALYCVVPFFINGSAFFPERFPVFFVMFAIAAAAASRPPRICSLAIGGFALYATSAVVLLQWANVSTITRQMRVVLDAPPAQDGSVGLVIAESQRPPKGLAFDPFLWAGAHYFRKSRAILANAPWLDLPIILIRPTHPDRWSGLTPWDASRLLSDAWCAGDAVPSLSFVVRQGASRRVTDATLSDLGWSPDPRNGAALGI